MLPLKCSLALQQQFELLGLPEAVEWEFCRRLNETVCAPTQQPNAAETVVVYNQLAQTRTEVVYVPIASSSATVVDGTTGNTLPVQVYAAGETVGNYARNTGEAKYVAAFEATVPAVGISTYKVCWRQSVCGVGGSKFTNWEFLYLFLFRFCLFVFLAIIHSFPSFFIRGATFLSWIFSPRVPF